MKYLSKFIICFLISVFCVQFTYAQSPIDANRMNRDISIMENILQEMFRTRWETRGSTVHVAPSGVFSFGGRNTIRGTYLPDYGVIFTIPGRSPGFAMYSDRDNGKSYSYSFHYSGDATSQREVNEETVTLRIKEFLRDYGSTIGQLKDEDRIMVIYNTRHQNHETAFFKMDGDDKQTQEIPAISVVANHSDLKAYRSGNIDTSELDSRLSVSTVSTDNNDQLDLKVMANIFETALNEQEGKSFRIRGSVNYLNLDNFGALFFFDARYGSSSGSFMLDFPKMSQFNFDDDTSFDEYSSSKARVEVQRAIEQRLNETKKRREETAEELKESYKNFISNIKEYLADYGRTLNSVSSNQHIMISIAISSSVDDIPERVDLQVRKSTLEAMDRGSMSREDAVKEIAVREY